MGVMIGHAVGRVALPPRAVGVRLPAAAPASAPSGGVAPPPGLDPSIPFEPISIGHDRRADWLRAKRLELAAMLDPLVDIRLWLLRRRHEQTNRAEGTPGAPLPELPGAQTMAVIGDFGEGSPEEYRIAAQVAASRPSHVLTVGDNVYPTGRERDWQRGFDPPGLFGDLVRRVPFMPALGNHDYYSYDLTPYFRRFPHLQGRAYYTWASGDTQFFVLDTEQRLDGGSVQLAWLGAQLAQSDARRRIVYLHRPPYTSASVEATPAWRDDLHRVLARHGVQLVLAGHEHSYERSHAIDGVTYIVTGGGGANLYPFRGEQPAWSAYRTMRHHFLRLAFEPDRIVVRAHDEHGRVFDTVAIATP